MKHLLQNRFTKRYFARGKWTSKITQAEVFATTLSAINCCLQNNIENVELILVLGNKPSAADVHIALF